MMAGASLASAYSQASAAEAQASFQRQQAEINMDLADRQGADAIHRGSLNASRLNTKTRQLVAEQRAGLASTGVDINSGSAMEIQQQARVMSAQDQMTIKNNATMEAFGLKVQAIGIGAQAAFNSQAAKTEANNTLLTGALRASAYGMDSYSKRDKPNKGPSGSKANSAMNTRDFYGYDEPNRYGGPGWSKRSNV